MTSVFAFSGVHTDPNTETQMDGFFYPPWDVVSEKCVFGQRKLWIRVDSTRFARFCQKKSFCVDGASKTLVEPPSHTELIGCLLEIC